MKIARASKAIAAPPRAPDTDAARARAYDFVQKSHIVDGRPPRKIGSVAHRGAGEVDSAVLVAADRMIDGLDSRRF